MSEQLLLGNVENPAVRKMVDAAKRRFLSAAKRGPQVVSSGHLGYGRIAVRELVDAAH